MLEEVSRFEIPLFFFKQYFKFSRIFPEQARIFPATLVFQANAGAVFQWAIDKAFNSLKDTITLVYLDDILIPSATVFLSENAQPQQDDSELPLW